MNARHAPIAAAVAAASLAGCGGKDAARLEHADGAPLIALANRIAGEHGCAQARDILALQARAISLINRGRVAPDLQETFLSRVNALAAGTDRCRPRAGAAEQAEGVEAWLRESTAD
jgi:hypothetical protein